MDNPVFIEPVPLVEPPAPNAEITDVAIPLAAAGAAAAQASAEPEISSVPGDVAPTAPPFGGFDDLLVGNSAPNPPSPSSVWIATSAAPPPADQLPPDQPTEPPAEEPTKAKRPFGEGVERDDAVDPTDSIFFAPAGPVSVNTEGVAVLAAVVAPPSAPVRVQQVLPTEPVPPAPPRVFDTELAGLEPTPVEQRVGRASRLFWLWFAANSSIAAVIFGTIIFGLGVSLSQALIATLAGVAVSFVPLGLGTLAGKRSGQPTMVISRATFGLVGNILPTVIALLSRLFWGAALLWVLGVGAASILTGAQLSGGFTQGELTIIVMAFALVVAVVIGFFGYALIAKVQLVVSIVSGIAILGFIALTAQYVDVRNALTVADGNWILVIAGAVLVFSFVGLVWANSSADLARYQQPGTSGAASMLWATFGAGLPAYVLIAYGSLLAASSRSIAASIASNPLTALGRLLPLWYPVPLLAATVLSLLSGVIIAIYSGGFAVQAIGLRLRRSFSTIIVGALVLAIALVLTMSITDFEQLFRDFATSIAVPVAAWAGIFGAEIMIRNRRYDSVSLLSRGGVYEDARWGNLAALVVISVVGFGLSSATVGWLSWEGFLYRLVGTPLTGQLATSDIGVFVALLLGILAPIAFGVPAIRRQEKAVREPV
jgi:purine-cytosine permease-like protein